MQFCAPRACHRTVASSRCCVHRALTPCEDCVRRKLSKPVLKSLRTNCRYLTERVANVLARKRDKMKQIVMSQDLRTWWGMKRQLTWPQCWDFSFKKQKFNCIFFCMCFILSVCLFCYFFFFIRMTGFSCEKRLSFCRDAGFYLCLARSFMYLPILFDFLAIYSHFFTSNTVT